MSLCLGDYRDIDVSVFNTVTYINTEAKFKVNCLTS